MAETPDDLEKTLNTVLDRREASEPVHLTEDGETGDRFLIYSDESGITVRLRYDGSGLWMTQAQIAELFGKDVSVVSRHIANVLEDGELDEGTSLQKLQTSTGRPATLYSLDMVISVGYRASSKQATLFRKWATRILVQFATKGFAIDVERLTERDERDHFKELRETIRGIRASEQNLYRELLAIIALCSDYAALDDHRKTVFFATVQNKLLYAVTSHTAAELRVERASGYKPHMGLTSWKKKEPAKVDIGTAKNYLAEPEVRDLNRFTTMLLDYIEQQADLQKLVTTSDAEATVEKFIRNNERPLLRGMGAVTKVQADAHCEAQYAIFDDLRKRKYLESADEDPF